MTEHYCFIAFESTHDAIESEQRLQKAGFSVRIIPAPPQIAAGCGLALRFSLTDYEKILPLMEEVTDKAYYQVLREGRKKEILPL